MIFGQFQNGAYLIFNITNCCANYKIRPISTKLYFYFYCIIELNFRYYSLLYEFCIPHLKKISLSLILENKRMTCYQFLRSKSVSITFAAKHFHYFQIRYPFNLLNVTYIVLYSREFNIFIYVQCIYLNSRIPHSERMIYILELRNAMQSALDDRHCQMLQHSCMMQCSHPSSPSRLGHCF